VNPNSRKIPLAVETALQMTSQESSQIFSQVGGHVPVRADVMTDDLLIGNFRSAQTTAFVRPQVAEFSNYWGPFSNMFNEVLKEGVSPEESLAKACVSMNEANGK
jgi:maltose-binding protein MalE